MNLKKIAYSLVGVTALGFAMAPVANATVSYAGANTFLNNYKAAPAVPNSDSFARDQKDGFPVGAFDDYWVFNFTGGVGDFSVNFVPIGGISGLIGGVYNASGFSCAATCSGGAIGALIVQAPVPGIAFPGISAYLAPGQYAIRVQGTNNSAQSSYTGQVAFRVPEPGSLALLGLGLIGIGAVRRRKV